MLFLNHQIIAIESVSSLLRKRSTFLLLSIGEAKDNTGSLAAGRWTVRAVHSENDNHELAMEAIWTICLKQYYSNINIES